LRKQAARSWANIGQLLPHLKEIRPKVTDLGKARGALKKNFKNLGQEIGTPYQTLLNDYLKNCAEHHIRPKTIWKKTG